MARPDQPRAVQAAVGDAGFDSYDDPIALEALLTSVVLIALAEVGDKTQLLSLVLAARLRQPAAIIAGIFLATLVNHALAGWAGALLAKALPAHALGWIVGISFLAFGIWALRPDSLEHAPRLGRASAFSTTFITFFIAEMGDKTQFATVALAARYDALLQVIMGTTAGMMIANVPAVLFGERLASKIPAQAIRLLAAAVFIATGALTIWGSLPTNA